MKKTYVLYNPHADNGNGKAHAYDLQKKFGETELCFFDMTEIESYQKFFAEIVPTDDVIVCGGDGTLNRFINDTENVLIKNELLYYACGSGNDFLRDLAKPSDEVFALGDYVRDLPVVTVKGKTYRFLNGVGYGIDGYCCEEGDRIRKKKPKKKINYTLIAIKGLLFKYKPTKAKVIVDGKEYDYEKVWLAPTMNGRYYGGGMMPTPDQNRSSAQKNVSVMVFHGSGKLRTLKIFPSIFTGKHVNSECVSVLSGRNVTVQFDQPRALQVDGETILNVSEYTVTSALSERVEEKEIA